jgi:hypothetical protein
MSKTKPRPQIPRCMASWPVMRRDGMTVTESRIVCHKSRGHLGSHTAVDPDGKTAATTLTATAFVLARLAEDAAPSWELLPYNCEPDCCAPAGWVGHRCLICGDTSFGGTVEAIDQAASDHAEDVHQRARVLAQVAALRAVVELHAPQDHPAHAGYGARRFCGVCGGDNAYESPCPTLLALCQPYADHEDFDPTWLAS